MRVFVLVLAMGVAGAEEFKSLLGANPPALREALARLGKMKTAPGTWTPRMLDARPPAGPCAVPLTPMTPDGKFAARQVPGKATAPMPAVTVPAPACVN